MPLLLVLVQDLKPVELGLIDGPRGHHNGLFVDGEHCRLEVEDVLDVDRHYLETPVMSHRSQLVDPVVVGPSRSTDIDHIVQEKDITTIQCARRPDPGDVETIDQHIFDGRRLATSRLRSRSGDQGYLAKDHSRVLYEHAIGVCLIGRHHMDGVPGLFEKMPVFLMLGPGPLQIYLGLAVSDQGLGKRVWDGANQGGSDRHRIESYS